VSPRAKVLPDGGVHVTATEPSTMSKALATKVTVAPAGPVASAVMSAGRVSAGGVVSTTVTSNDPVPVLRWSSVAEQPTSTVPRAKVLPDGGTQMTGTSRSTTSEAVTEKVTTAPPGPVASSVMSLGMASTGAVRSDTSTEKVEVRSLPAASVALQVTRVATPSEKVSPDAGSH
jgi:hypothetical protein